MSDRQLLSVYLKPQWRRTALLAFLLCCGSGLTLLSPQIIRYFIDSAIGGVTGAPLVAAALLFLGAAAARQVVAMAGDYTSEYIAWKSTNALRADLALHCLRLDMPFHKAHPPGELIERIDGDVSALGNFLSRFGVQVAGSVVLLLGILVALYGTDWRIGAGFTVYAAAALGLLRRLQHAGVRQWATSRQAEAEHYSFLEERLLGAEDIRSAGAERYILMRLRGLTQSMLGRYRTARLTSNITYFASSGLYALGYALGLGIGAWLYGEGRISIGTAYLIVSYIALLAGPLDELRRQVQDLQHASASIARVNELFARQPDVRDAPHAELPTGPLSVAFEDATFRYDEANMVFDGVSLGIAPGEVLGVLGRTGSGKSTLTRLLFRLYDLQSGSIRLGGADIRDVGLADLRGRIALVTQDVQLFEAAIRDNLALFNPRIDDAQIEAGLRALGLWTWVEARQGGLQARLAHGGQGLSAGEAQLLALARAFLKDPGLVVLDEASSRLDPGTEQLLERAVEQLLRGRTGIIIAHRLRTVQRADSIAIFENGRIVERGRREALAGDPQSRFYRLLQAGLDEALAADSAPEEAQHEHVAV